MIMLQGNCCTGMSKHQRQFIDFSMQGQPVGTIRMAHYRLDEWLVPYHVMIASITCKPDLSFRLANYFGS